MKMQRRPEAIRMPQSVQTVLSGLNVARIAAGTTTALPRQHNSGADPDFSLVEANY